MLYLLCGIVLSLLTVLVLTIFQKHPKARAIADKTWLLNELVDEKDGNIPSIGVATIVVWPLTLGVAGVLALSIGLTQFQLLIQKWVQK